MGRKGGGGRSQPRPRPRPSPSSRSIVNTHKLLRYLDSCKIKNPTLDEAVDFLRSANPEYRRHKEFIFRRTVQDILQNNRTPIKNSKSKRPPSSDLESDSVDDDDNDVRAPARKKSKKSASEERLLRIESEHRVRRFGSEDDEDESESEESGSEESEEDGAVSTSEDGIYAEKVEPKFDLLKSTLRDAYSGSSKAATIMEEETEIADKRKLINASSILRGGGGGGEVKKKVGDKGESSNANAGEVGDDIKKGDGGPRFRDLGGMDAILEELKMEVIVPLCHPQIPRWLGVRPMAGILLHGPPGCGKTKLAHAIANETGVPFYKISATEIVSGVSGASEENIRDLFTKAYRTAPSIVFIDEIDAIASKRENMQREMERRIVTQLMTCMDEQHAPANGESKTESSGGRPGYVLVIGATNRPDAVDPALRRPGRFDREFVLGVPDESARIKILSVLTRDLRVEGSFDLTKLARLSPGFVGADLTALANKAGNLAMKRIIDRKKAELLREAAITMADFEELIEGWWKQPWSPEEMETLYITMADFEEAAKIVQPSLRREGFSTIPNVKWEDVGGLDRLRQKFDRYIVRRIKYPEIYEEFKVNLETGFLLYGPPGCGKTLIAKAVANEAGANFIHIKGPDLLNKYVGESELAVRKIFSRARTCAPCILFFDEVDALTTKRGREGGWVVERLLTQLLTELTEERPGVFVIGATNRLEVMDPAVLRPGRFGKLIYIPLPNPDQRGLILTALARNKPIDADTDLIAIGKKEACENLSGADLAALLNESAMAALDEKLASNENSSVQIPWTIKLAHFDKALQNIKPSVSDKQKHYYQTLSASFNTSMK